MRHLPAGTWKGAETGLGSVVGKPRAQTGDIPSCTTTLFWHRSRAQSQRRKTHGFLASTRCAHMWFLVCCAARLVCRLAVLCVCAHTCSLRWWALRAGCLLICSLLGTLSLAALRTGKWLGLGVGAAPQCEPARKGSCRPAFGPKILQIARCENQPNPSAKKAFLWPCFWVHLAAPELGPP